MIPNQRITKRSRFLDECWVGILATYGNLRLRKCRSDCAQISDARPTTTFGEDAPMKRENLAESQKPHMAKRWYNSRFF